MISICLQKFLISFFDFKEEWILYSTNESSRKDRKDFLFVFVLQQPCSGIFMILQKKIPQNDLKPVSWIHIIEACSFSKSWKTLVSSFLVLRIGTQNVLIYHLQICKNQIEILQVDNNFFNDTLPLTAMTFKKHFVNKQSVKKKYQCNIWLLEA